MPRKKKFLPSISVYQAKSVLREERGVSQLELALDIGIKSVAFFSNCENCCYGKHFNLEHLYKISKSLQVPIQNFFD